jgi:peptide/nickel transport system permease protein
MTRLLRDRRGAFGALVLLIVVLCAAGAPLVTSGDPTAQRDIVATRFLPPLAVLVSLALGVIVGAVAGYWRGPVSITLLGFTDFALALPRVVLLLLLAALWRPSTALVILVLGLTGWMSIARLVHGEVRALAARPFVEGAVAVGARRLRVLARHILPNALTPVIVAAALGVGNAIMLEAGMSYLGLGVQPPTPSWGNMIASGRDTLVNAPWVATAPGVALVLVVIACTLLGDALRDVLDPSARR